MSFIVDRSSSVRLDQAIELIENAQRADEISAEKKASLQQQQPGEASRTTSPLQAFKYADKTDWTLLTISWLCAGALGVLPPLNMLVMGNGISGAGTGDTSVFTKMIRNFVILGSVALCLGYTTVVLNEMSAERQVRRIKREYVDTVMRQEVGYFDLKDVGTLASELESSVVQIRDGNGLKSGQIVRSFCMFVGGYAVGLSKDWAMALLMTVAIPLIFLSFATLIRTLNKSTKRSREEYAKAGSVVEETLPAIRTVAAFGLEDIFRGRFDALVRACQASDMNGAAWKGVCLGIAFLILYGSYALGWWWGGRTVHKKLIDSDGTNLGYGGVILSTFFAIMMSAFSLAGMTPNISALSTSAAAVSDVSDLVSRQSAIDPSDPKGQTKEALSGEIEFSHVRFAYPSRPEKTIYRDVSFKINAGETVALVGPSGAGKSTVIQLIERFYDPSGGEILMDGVASTDYNLQWLRKQMALVSQEPRLFCTTIRQNIAYGKPGATEPEIVAAAKAANAHGFISALSDGYDTNVGQGGSLLSGGQKQRIAIARAIIRNPSILILDEATSALDNQSEKIVQQALDDLVKAKRRTTIIIAHRLTTIRNADRIIVVDNVRGKGSMVVEQGTHDELMLIQGGIYKALVDAQTGKKDEHLRAAEPLTFRTTKGWSQMLSGQLSRQSSKGRLGSFVSRDGSRLKAVPEEAPIKIKPIKPTRKLYRQMRYDWPMAILEFISAAAAGASQPINAVILSAFLGTFFTYDHDKTVQANADYITERTNTLSLYYVALACAVAICMSLMSYSGDYTGFHAVTRLRQNVFHNVIYQDMEFFDDPIHNTGALSSVLSGDCETAKTILGANLATTIENVLSMCVAIVIGLLSHWRLALVAASSYFLIIPAGFMQSRLVQGTSAAMGAIDEEDTPAFVLNEIFTNLKIVASFGLQNQMLQQYESALTKYYKKGMRNAYVTAFACALTDSLMFFANAISYKYASHLMKQGGLHLEKMMRCLLAIMMSGNGVSRTAAFTTDEKKAEIACANIFALIERKPKIDARSILGSDKPLKGNIEVRNIKFRYPGRPNVPVMNDVSFTIEAGKTVAMVGESGSGKSTIVQLLERFYDVEASEDFRARIREHNAEIDALPNANKESEKDLRRLESATDMFGGQLRVENHNIIDMNVKHLRSSMGLVGQEPVLFDVTVEENIRYGKMDATLEEIQRAAKLANAHEFIERLPEGYQTKVGKGGGLLSGGQKQRVAIARAIIRDPKILLLDEATSALDPESEEIVQKALDDLLQTSKRTTIVIAHRLSTVRNADKIVVFAPEPGVGSKVVEQGNHEQLMNIPNGIYRNLVNIANSEGRQT